MRILLSSALAALLFFTCACGSNAPAPTLTPSALPTAAVTAAPQTPLPTEAPPQETNTMEIQITAGDTAFSATLTEGPAARAFLAQLPLSITMEELNGNEKFYYLADGLPADAAAPGEIKAGDLMLYGSDCLVLFYEDFPTVYRYTRLGTIADADGLAAALGGESAAVTFSRAAHFVE